MALIRLNNQSLTAVSALPAAITTGTVLQVVSGSTTTQTSTSSTSFQATNITASITPSSASSKIFVMVTAATETRTSASNGSYPQVIAVFRDSTEIASTAIGTREASGFFDHVNSGTSVSKLDTPATTSAITYTVKIKSNMSTTTVSCPFGGYEGVITLTEIAS